MNAYVCRNCGQRYDRAGYCAADGSPLEGSDDPLLGSEIGRYRLARLLGEGGMGRVYLAIQPAIGSRVAIKILSDQCARSPELLERFFAEARAVNLIHHESIVSVIDMAQLPDGRPFIIMEYVEGATLADVLRAGPVPLGGLVQAATEIFSALAAAHAIGIVHRDLKPDNVLITAEGHAKVLDFGIAKLAPGLQQNLSPRTRTGALLGTPQYMAPEQITGSGVVDARADVYAAGVMLFEAIGGRRPFEGETLFDLMRAHLEVPPPPLRALRPDVPPALEGVVMTALAKQPGDRFQSVTAMSQALQHAADALPADQWRPLSSRGGNSGMLRPGSGSRPGTRSPANLALRPTQPAEPVTTSRKGRGALIAAVAIGVVALGIVAIVIATSKSGARDSVAAATPGSGSPDPGAGTAGAPGGSSVAAVPDPPDAAPPPTPGSGSGSAAPVPPARPHTDKHEPAHTVTAPPDAGPTIVGGGSAADHGVIIGKNVDIGPNVVIGSQTAGKAKPPAFEKPADYDPKHFDANSYAPRALALARTIYPDAGFTRFDMVAVYPDGHADLTLTDDDASYLFRSPAHSVRPTDVPANLPVELACYVEVTVHARTVSVRARDLSMDETCKWPLRPLPHCPLSAIWDKAKQKGAQANTIAKVDFLSDGKWFFDNEYEGAGITESFADHCP